MDALVAGEIARNDMPSTNSLRMVARFATDSLFILNMNKL